MKIILASGSPRRKSLLRMMRVEFEVILSEFEEYVDPKLTINELVEELAMGKVMEVAKKHPEAIVIGGDSMVTMDGSQLGKPKDATEAKTMLRGYSGRSHQVVTSIAVVCLDKNFKKVSSDSTTVHFDELSDGFINKYIATKTMFDKAGAYGIQHPMMSKHVEKIEGRLDNVIGMPTNIVAEYLNELGLNVRPIEIKREEFMSSEGMFG